MDASPQQWYEQVWNNQASSSCETWFPNVVDTSVLLIPESLGTSREAWAWRYRSTLELDGTPTLGRVATYSGGGYVLELGVTRDEAAAGVDYLRRLLWIDRTARAVFAEFNLYNPATNLFTAVEFVR